MSHPCPEHITCAFCDKPISSSNKSREHIIPQSIGGTRTVRSFICRECNSKSGQTWDSDLFDQLRYFCLKFDIARQKGATLSYVFRTAGGASVRMHSGGRLSAGKPSFQKTRDGNNIRYEISAGTYEELREIVKDLRREHPQIDIVKCMKTIQHSDLFSSDPLELAPYLLYNRSFQKSMVKSAVALAYQAGVSIGRSADKAIRFLRNECLTECCYPCYQVDALANRELGAPIHCVHIKGDSVSGMLLAYVEFFGFVRIVACLSGSYSGSAFDDTYAINPIDGEPLDVSVNIDGSTIDAAMNQSSEGIPEAVARAMIPILHEGTIFERSLAIARSITEECADTVLSYVTDKRGNSASDSDIDELRRRMLDAVIPLIRHYSKPMEVPKGTIPEGGRLFGDTDDVRFT